MHNLLTVKETAKYLRIPLPTVYYLVQRGQLPAIQIGGRWRIKKNALDKDILKEEKSGQPTVLVVDDDESLQNLFKLFLKKIGFSRVVVGTVKEAIAALEKQKFDLVSLSSAPSRKRSLRWRNKNSISSFLISNFPMVLPMTFTISLSGNNPIVPSLSLPVTPIAKCSIAFWRRGQSRF